MCMVPKQETYVYLNNHSQKDSCIVSKLNRALSFKINLFRVCKTNQHLSIINIEHIKEIVGICISERFKVNFK